MPTTNSASHAAKASRRLVRDWPGRMLTAPRTWRAKEVTSWLSPACDKYVRSSPVMCPSSLSSHPLNPSRHHDDNDHLSLRDWRRNVKENRQFLEKGA